MRSINSTEGFTVLKNLSIANGIEIFNAFKYFISKDEHGSPIIKMPSEMDVELQHRLVTLLPPLTDTACTACIAFAAKTVACMLKGHCLYSICVLL